MKNSYFVIYKPFGILSQFTDEGTGHPTLGSLFDFPKDVYPVGRLDRESEGLLILTNDKKLNDLLLNPRRGHQREYWVQVEGIPGDRALNELRQGPTIRVGKSYYQTRPAVTSLFKEEPEGIPERVPPIRERKTIPTSWISLTLTEGKNRQVRKMTAKVGFPTLRLIRYRIEKLVLPEWEVGGVFEFSEKELYEALF